MNRCEYLKRAFDLHNSGKIDANTYDAMVMNADAFCDDEDYDERLPRTYAEIEYTSEQLESDPIAIMGARWDDMNYRHYMER